MPTPNNTNMKNSTAIGSLKYSFVYIRGVGQVTTFGF